MTSTDVPCRRFLWLHQVPHQRLCQTHSFSTRMEQRRPRNIVSSGTELIPHTVRISLPAERRLHRTAPRNNSGESSVTRREWWLGRDHLQLSRFNRLKFETFTGGQFPNQPPVKPAFFSPATMYGFFRIVF